MVATKMVIEKVMRQRVKRGYSRVRYRIRYPQSSTQSTETDIRNWKPSIIGKKKNIPAISNTKGCSSVFLTRHLGLPQRRIA
jgi:hypothetical protein